LGSSGLEVLKFGQCRNFLAMTGSFKQFINRSSHNLLPDTDHEKIILLEGNNYDVIPL